MLSERERERNSFLSSYLASMIEEILAQLNSAQLSSAQLNSTQLNSTQTATRAKDTKLRHTLANQSDCKVAATQSTKYFAIFVFVLNVVQSFSSLHNNKLNKAKHFDALEFEVKSVELEVKHSLAVKRVRRVELS